VSRVRKKTFNLKFIIRLLDRGYPTKFAYSTKNPKKNYWNTISKNQNENLPKKSMFGTLKHPTEFASETSKTIGLKGYSKNLNLKKRSV
jgi:hypothetical protein